MDNNLINPNQYRHYGISVFDDPTDKYRELGLAIDYNLFILMYIDGTTCGFDSNCPTLEDMDYYKRIEVSHETDWDPLTVHLNVSSVDKENRYIVHAVLQFEYFYNFSICDIALEHQITTAKKFIDVVNITPGIIERIAKAVGSNERHHSPTAENISMEWGCSVTAANNTLINMTQEWIQSTVITLTSRYRMDLLSQDPPLK